MTETFCGKSIFLDTSETNFYDDSTQFFTTNVFGLVSRDRGGRLPSINFISE